MTLPSADGHEVATNRLCEFLVVATHAILHLHGIYPARLFVLRRKYGIATMCSKHPTLNSYITRTVTALRPWLQSGQVQSVSIPIFTKEQQHPSRRVAHARYVFEIATLPDAAPSAADLAALDAQLRAHLCRLLAEVPPTPGVRGQEILWDFVVRTSGVRVGRDWVPADGEERCEIERPIALPLKDVDPNATTFAIASRAEFPDEDKSDNMMHLGPGN